MIGNHRWLVLAVSLCSSLGVRATLAQAAPTPPRQPSVEAGQCYPACRSGFLCYGARCISACNPVCGGAEVCTPDGRCVSACNPPCAPDQTCAPDGQCLASSPGAPAADRPAAVPPAQPSYPTAPATTAPYSAYPGTYPGAYPGANLGAYPGAPPGPAADPGWANGAAAFGFISAPVVMALTLGAMSQNDPKTADSARALGSTAILLFGVACPVIATGGGSARNSPGVTGSPTLRVWSWVGYGLALLDSLTLLAISYDTTVSDGQIASVGLLASLSTLGLALDAKESASQAEALAGRRVALPLGAVHAHPALGLAWTTEGSGVPTLGWRGTF
jgi:hypothetical protein